MHNKISLTPQVQEALARIQAIDVTAIDNKILAGRQFYEEFIPLAGEADDLFLVQDMDIPLTKRDIKIRIYKPSDSTVLPVLVYFHGGWFSAGSLETHDRPLRNLANLSGVAIIAVDYRLAPEHPFPAGFDDCYQALVWVKDHAATLGIDVNSIAVAGDSAGAALATAVVRKTISLQSLEIACQVLVYPVTDSSLSTDSWKEFADGPNLTLEGAIAAWEQYTPAPQDRINPNAAPLFAEDLSGMPDTLIIEAEFDPLRDEAIAYANKLRAANCEVTETLYKGMVHGFFQMGGVIAEGKQVIKEIAEYLQQHLGKA